MKIYEQIEGRLREFILAQPVFFVGTAPTSVDGHVNVSPKGMHGTFAVLDPHHVAYVDYTGSGSETVGHLRDNGRIVLMFCSFDRAPNIVRLHGHGRPLFPDDPGYPELLRHFPEAPDRGRRAIIDVVVERVSDSCGYAVPRMEFLGDRDVLRQWTDRKTDDQLVQYRADKNAYSIDRLPSIPPVAG